MSTRTFKSKISTALSRSKALADVGGKVYIFYAAFVVLWQVRDELYNSN